MLLENGWFKEEKDKEVLKEAITDVTAFRSQEISDHSNSQEEAIRLLEETNYQLELIDQKIRIAASTSSEKEEDSFSSLKEEFEETVLSIATELHLYGAVNPSFQSTIDLYQGISNDVLGTLDSIESESSMTDELAEQWQKNSNAFLDLSEKIKIELTDTLDTVQSLPQVYN